MRNDIIIFDALKEANLLLKQAKISTHNLDVKILLSHVLNLSHHEELILKLNDKISKKEYENFKILIKRRLKNEPVAYITSYKHFWKHTFAVDNHVLIPRPETEIIIELLLLKLKHQLKHNLKILELGTGSGCLILSLLSEFKNSQGIAVDISKRAIDIAKLNAFNLNLGSRINFIVSDWFEKIKNIEKFDLIISNPPYISLDDWNKLEENVKNYEPKIALTDDEDGLKSYRIIAKNSINFLKKEGLIILEAGIGQSFQIRGIFKEHGFKVKFYNDLQNIKRIAIISRS